MKNASPFIYVYVCVCCRIAMVCTCLLSLFHSMGLLQGLDFYNYRVCGWWPWKSHFSVMATVYGRLSLQNSKSMYLYTWSYTCSPSKLLGQNQDSIWQNKYTCIFTQNLYLKYLVFLLIKPIVSWNLFILILWLIKDHPIIFKLPKWLI